MEFGFSIAAGLLVVMLVTCWQQQMFIIKLNWLTEITDA